MQRTYGKMLLVDFRGAIGLLLLLLLISIPAAALAHVPLPRTGQNVCWDTKGNMIYCIDTGQDGETQAGVVWPEPRFTDNGDQTMRDNLTGLIWSKHADPSGPEACWELTKNTWKEALDFVACLNSNNYLNQSDWRMPNRKELDSLVNHQQGDKVTWLKDQNFIFNNYQEYDYWSSSTRADHSDFAWYMNLIESDWHYDIKNYGKRVWPVRSGYGGMVDLPKSGQTIAYAPGDDGSLQKGRDWSPFDRFTDNKNGTVTDTLTGLTWLRNANCRDTSGGISKEDGYLTWVEALIWSKNLASYTCGLQDGSVAGDWRLPNVKELESLISLAEHDPSLPKGPTGGYPFEYVQSDNYWSSTTDAKYMDSANYVNMYYGETYLFNKGGYLYVWPVRGGLQKSFSMVLSKSGSGTVAITSPNSMDCGDQCSTFTVSFEADTNVMLKASAMAGSIFVGWSGACTGSSQYCDVKMDGPKTVTATFAKPPPALYASFTNAGIWQWGSSGWTRLTPDRPAGMVASSGTSMYASFPDNGIWKWNGTGWTRLTPDNPVSMVASGSSLYANFTGKGIWQWNGSGWTQLTPDNPVGESMIVSGSNLYVKFANGIWLWNGSGWRNLTPDKPDSMAAAGTNLYGSFTGNGIWQWSGTNWSKLTPDNPEEMAAAGTNLYGKFANGIWQWTGSGWTHLTPDKPASMAAAGPYLYGSFTGNGIWQWNGTNWSQLTPDNPYMMAVGE
jgi:hypothetical protein